MASEKFIYIDTLTCDVARLRAIVRVLQERIAQIEASETVETTRELMHSPRAAMPIERLDLTPRVHNALKRAGFTSAGDVLAANAQELLSVRSLGFAALEEIGGRLVLNGVLTLEQARAQFGC